MRTRRSARALLAVSAASLAFAGPAALPAAADDSSSSVPTTPVPTPVDPNQPPAKVPTPQPGPIVADAGTGLGLIRVLPNTIPTNSIIPVPGQPKQSLLELGMGLASARANSLAYLAQEHATADASPYGFAEQGRSVPMPGSLSQTADPDHPQPTTGGMSPPPSPLDALVRMGALTGSAQARWDERLGPCVRPVSDATTSLADLSAVNAIPALPATPDQLINAPAALREAFSGGRMRGPLSQLGGLLSGGGKPSADGTGSLLRMPDALNAHSTVDLVDAHGQPGKAVRSTSRVQVASFQLFAGTPQEIDINVVGQPKLTAISAGDPSTSTVDYQAPVLRLARAGKDLGTLDAAHPSLDLPIGVPLPGAPQLSDVPLMGHAPDPHVLDVGALRLGLGDLKKGFLSDGSLGAEAHMFDLEVLRGQPIGIPTSLVKISFGEQVTRAGAPRGGVMCEAPPAAGAAGSGPGEAAGPGVGDSDAALPQLALTGASYATVPLFWLGTGLLLAGAVLVAALPLRNRR